MARRRGGQTSIPMKEAPSGMGQSHENGASPSSSGVPEMPSFETDPVTHRVDTPVVAEALASVHDEAAVDLTTELLETTSVSALELHPAQTTERDAVAAPDVAGDVSASSGGTQSEPPFEDVPISVSEPANLDLQSVTPSAASPYDGQVHPIEAPQSFAVSSTPAAASLTFTQAAVQMNAVAWEHFRAEGEAMLTCLQALGRAQTPSQVIDLQTREMSRALEAAVRFGEAFAAPARQILTATGIWPKDAA